MKIIEIRPLWTIAQSLLALKGSGRISVDSIAKEPYSGEIYDVDIGNDVVLVRRKSVPEFDYNNYMHKIILEDGSEG